MDYKDYYQILGVPKDASADDVQRAYRKLARKLHPDVNREAGSEDRFKEVSEAYEVLKDPEKRATYDRYGSAWKAAGQHGGPPPGFEHVRFDFGGEGASGFSSFFDGLFGGGRGGRGATGSPFAGFEFDLGGGGGRRGGFATRGRDQETRLVLSLEEAAAGGEREITLQNPTTGRAEVLKVTLPRGVKPGQRIRLAGKGEGGSGGAGDLYLKIALQAHPALRLDGRDLHTSLPVTPWDAALGGEATLTTLEGPVKVRVPAGSSSGRRIRLRGRGYPGPRGESGDLFAEIKIVVPEELSERERELFGELAKVSTFRAR